MMKLNLFYLLVSLPFFSYCQNSSARIFDLVIKNAEVVDGTGGEKYFANIIVDGDSIVEIQRDTTLIPSAVNLINASGFKVTPGFIDTHAHGNPIETPQFENFLAMGVTTISLGQDGFSPEIEDLEEWFTLHRQPHRY